MLTKKEVTNRINPNEEEAYKQYPEQNNLFNIF